VGVSALLHDPAFIAIIKVNSSGGLLVRHPHLVPTVPFACPFNVGDLGQLALGLD
jgi:hypothetical protein